ncbi:MAG: hypothetical protein QOE58_3493 [Actinomycetota bacterium]|nr:hypothetical protein [Actinomycetota bacterium]
MSIGEALATDDPRRVHVAWDSIQQRLEETEGDLYVLFTQDSPVPRPPRERRAAVEEAMALATAAVDEEVYGRDVSPSPYGPVVWIDYITSEDDLRTWLNVFAASLEGAGWSGRVEAHPQAWFPEGLPWTPRPTAFLAYRLDTPDSDPSVRTRRTVAPWTTVALCRDAIEWGRFEGAQAYLQTGGSQILFDPSRADEILVRITDFAGAGITFLRQEPFRICQMNLWARAEPAGQCVYQLEDERLDWKAIVQELTQLLIRHADTLDLAIVRLAQAGAHSWRHLKSPPPPQVSEGEVVANRHLWDRFVPDAHGIQLLTEAHLARAGNLDAWDVQRLTPDRYLVQAKDLRPWFAENETNPDILTAARQDFRDMLLTPEIIEAHGDL